MQVPALELGREPSRSISLQIPNRGFSGITSRRICRIHQISLDYRRALEQLDEFLEAIGGDSAGRDAQDVDSCASGG